jgi:hypothetical protein
MPVARPSPMKRPHEMTLGEIVAAIVHTLGEIERMLNEGVPEHEIDARAALLPALFEERKRRMH